MTHLWILPLVCRLAMFAPAVFKKPFKFGLQTGNRFVWTPLGAGGLIIALLFTKGVTEIEP